ncbi:MAG: DeoR/GlpR family DNA-binding transcription regulator [Lachnospiraceae bacterium]|nr:DeoR/GlpR family DNA-binding transcription regulator [Lachnospiraceae bacterium]
MLSAERRNLILQEAQVKKKVFVNDLSKRFNVSEETIRRDLEKLDEDGFVKKGYGGAVLNEDYGTDLPLNIRCKTNPEGKSKIADLTEDEIVSGDHIFLDASSTTAFISRMLKKKEIAKLSVITNSIENAVTLGSIDGTHVILTGGTLKYESMSLMGAKTLETIGQYHMDKAFISCNGLDMESGITEGNDDTVSVKQAAIEASDKIYLVVDSEKFGRTSFSQVCDLSRIDVLITDRKPSKEWLDRLKELNIRIIYPSDGDVTGSEVNK